MDERRELQHGVSEPGGSGAIGPDAERELCERFAQRIRLYGLRHLGDEAAAADLVQDVLLVLLHSVREGRIQDPAHLERFVLGTCRNLVAKIRRGEQRTRTFERAALPLAEPATCRGPRAMRSRTTSSPATRARRLRPGSPRWRTAWRGRCRRSFARTTSSGCTRTGAER